MGDVLMLGGREVPTTGPVEIGGGSGTLPPAYEFAALVMPALHWNPGPWREVPWSSSRFRYTLLLVKGDRRQRRRGRRRLAALDRKERDAARS